MDFVSNMRSKTGLTGKSASTPEEEPAAKEGEEAIEGEKAEPPSSTGATGFMSSIFKGPFKNSENDERKASISSEAEKKEEGQSAGNFVSNLLSKNPFKNTTKSEGEEKERKPSETGSSSSATGQIAEEVDEVTAENGEAVSQKAIDGAKSIGNFLYSVANKAGQTVSATAKQIKQTVESNSLLGDFTKEQQEFMKEHGGNIEVGEPPWIGCENADEVRSQVISLSQDKRNFVRNPPGGVQFDFDMQSSLPIALAILKEDANLSKMRFEIVPKLVNEETFWRNYFYRVSLLKQSTQANNLKGCKGWASSSSSEAEGPDSPTSEQGEFVSDSFQGDMSTEDIQKGMSELGVGKDKVSTNDADKNWEDEITKDLQEFEVVGGVNTEADDAELERDLAAL